MKKLFLVLIITINIIACKKQDKNPLLEKDTDEMDGRISLVTNNMQTKYGTFSSSASLQANFKEKLNVNEMAIEDFTLTKHPTGMFYNSTSTNNQLEQKYPSYYGKGLTIKLNEKESFISSKVPYANYVTIDSELSEWKISKSKGITIKWKLRSLTSNFISNTSQVNSTGTIANAIMEIDPIDIPTQVDGSRTVVSIVPDDLQNTTGTSLYWLVDQNAQSFTIDPSVLTQYGINETITISISSGTEDTYYISGDPIYLLALNITSLPSIQVIE